jgi:hypothetical protein
MGLLSWLLGGRRKINRTGTLGGEHSVLDDVLENQPSPLLGTRIQREVFLAQREEAVHADLARDVSSAFDDLEEAERRQRDALRKPDD